MKFLITGARGQLGRTFVRDLAAAHEVTALGRADLDLADAPAVLAAVDAARPDVIVNCAAYNAVDRAEDDAAGALAVNTLAVRTLARAAGSNGAALVHFSTDFVFDGEASTPYTEDDEPNPRSVYAQSKLAGEWLALEAPRAYVLRVESLFGGPAARSSVDRIIEALRGGGEAPVFVDRIVSPSYVDDVVAATVALLERGAAPGLYHCVNGGHTSWHALGEFIAARLQASGRLVPVHVDDVPMRAPRPRYCALSNAKLAAAGVPMPHWQDAVERHVQLTIDD